jgi:hypothetical protein
MRLEESEAIRRILERYSNTLAISIVINLGSGDVERLLKTKPWVDKNVFLPLKSLGIAVINVDACPFPGVDLVKDLSLPNGLDFVDKTIGPRLFILANVLEHIPRPSCDTLLNKIYSKMSKGDGLIITGPYDYPYHADPIDTMYRPSPDDLAAFIPLLWTEKHLVVCGSYREEFSRMSLPKKIRRLLKPLWIFQKPVKWLENHRLVYLFKPYKISVVFGIKQ